MRTMQMEQYGVSELSGLEAREVEGGSFPGKLGYVLGSCVAYATNAVEMVNNLMLDVVKGKVIDKIFK